MSDPRPSYVIAAEFQEFLNCLPGRAENIIKQFGWYNDVPLVSVWHVAQVSDIEWARHPNCGLKTIAHIKAALLKFGYAMRHDPIFTRSPEPMEWRPKLTKRQEEVLVMSYDMTPKEIAEKLGITEGTVRVHQQAIRERAEFLRSIR